MTKYVIESYTTIPEADRGGRPIDKKLAELVEKAANDVISGKFATECEAAEAYLSEYAKRVLIKEDGSYLHKKKDLKKRIKHEIEKILQL
ncbi:MAG: hypothetical protein ACREPB_04740 [Arenimonas sp.]